MRIQTFTTRAVSITRTAASPVFSNSDHSLADISASEQRDEGVGHVFEPLSDGFFILELAL